MPDPKRSSRSKADKKVNLDTLGLEMVKKPPKAVDF